ncbi:hypothetical protein [Stenotrophomonas sepilia]|uniref:hypothetical protein n=1 Tax=Stenotrophomonas sepilia TaxID=2860290 RepID=UPI002E775FF2|nr:hypothetical protein [Stenotrophomonas sepilia]
MKSFISSAAFAASQAMSHAGQSVKRSHLVEVISAMLGYQSFAALCVEEADTTLEYHLADAELYVLNMPLARDRAEKLGVLHSLLACKEAISSTFPAPVYGDIEAFWDSHARELLEAEIANGEDTAAAMAACNAVFPDSPDLGPPEDSADLWASTDGWSIEARGTMSGEYDPEGDQMFNGHTLDVWGELFYIKAGRAGLIFEESQEGAELDDDWRDDDSDDLDEQYAERMERDD